MNNTNPHTFHIPVMGLGYTIDSPIKISHFGISSVLSIGDDLLIEKIRKHYSNEYGFEYTEIDIKDENHRADRITSYLNLSKKIIEIKFNDLKSQTFEEGTDLTKYFEMLSPDSILFSSYKQMIEEEKSEIKETLQKELKDKMICGDIDVNIMSKVDNPTFAKDKTQLPIEYNDAMAALRGYALSDVESNIVISAGLNPRLFAYFESFPDFLPNAEGVIKKKVILKVSDYRSALIQGKFLAKKGVWTSEFRIESGLNCGGHAFATQGDLLGPILDKFNENREELIQEIFSTYQESQKERNKFVPETPYEMKFSAQGGVGNCEEHQMLLNAFNIDSVGWGTPFLLVPEAVSIDTSTIKLLEECNEEDLYTSAISPLGVPFNTVKGTTIEKTMQELLDKNRPGSSCPKKFLSFNTEFTEKPICIASRQYVHLKIQSLDSSGLPEKELEKQKREVLEKTCLCSGLGTSALIDKEISTKVEGDGIAVCPGPNIAYFSRTFSLKEMVDHIYGKINILNNKKRPHMFMKELNMYIEHFKKEVATNFDPLNKKQMNKLKEFKSNLEEGISYYKTLFSNWKTNAFENSKDLLEELNKQSLLLKAIEIEVATA